VLSRSMALRIVNNFRAQAMPHTNARSEKLTVRSCLVTRALLAYELGLHGELETLSWAYGNSELDRQHIQP
jgi:hypothetical protein